MRRECRECFPLHRELAIRTCITARAWRACRDTCRDLKLAVSFEVGGGENIPGIPGACANRNFGYLVRGTCGLNSFTYQVGQLWNEMPTRYLSRPPYVYNGNTTSWKPSLYWDGVLVVFILQDWYRSILLGEKDNSLCIYIYIYICAENCSIPTWYNTILRMT